MGKQGQAHRQVSEGQHDAVIATLGDVEVKPALEMDFAQLLDGYGTSQEAYDRVMLIILGVLCDEPEETITGWIKDAPGGSDA
jgi:hypothetical protein